MGAPYPIEIREQMLQLKQEGKTNKEISEIVDLDTKRVGWFFGNYARSEREKELEKIIKAQKKLIKLYKGFLHLSGRM